MKSSAESTKSASSPRRSKRSRTARAKPFLFISGLLISGVCLYLAFRKVDFDTFVREFQKLGLLPVLGALILVNLHNFLLAYRWKRIVSPLGPCPYWPAFWSLRMSFFFNAALPARLGEPFRIWFLNRMTKISTPKLVGAMGADRLVDFLSLCTLVYVSAIVLGMRGTLPPTKTIIGVTFAALAVFIILAKLPKTSRYRWVHWTLQMRARIFEGIAVLKSARALSITVPVSFAGWLIEAMVIVAFSYGLDNPMSIFRALMVVAGVNIAIAIPSSPGNIGTFQLGAMTMLLFLGVPKGQAATISVLYHLVQLIPTLLIGAGGYYYYFFRARRIREEPSLDVLTTIEEKAILKQD